MILVPVSLVPVTEGISLQDGIPPLYSHGGPLQLSASLLRACQTKAR